MTVVDIFLAFHYYYELILLQNWLNVGRPTGYALILAPTRELAVQIAETAKSIMSHFVEDVTNGTPGNPLNVFRLIGGENSVDQAISLAWCRHHLIVGKLLPNNIVTV